MIATNPLIYRPEELPPPCGESVGLVERIRSRVSPGAGLLLDCLTRITDGELSVAIRASQGWLYVRYAALWCERNVGLAPEVSQPSYATFRRSLAELASAAIVRVVQKHKRAELWLLSPLRAPPEEQLSLPLRCESFSGSPNESDSHVSSDCERESGLRLYTPDDTGEGHDELSHRVGDRRGDLLARGAGDGGSRGGDVPAHEPRDRRAGAGGRTAVAAGVRGLAPHAADLAGAGWCAPDAHAGARLEAQPHAAGAARSRADLQATPATQVREPAGARESSGPTPAPARSVSEARQTSTSSSVCLHTQKTFTSGRTANRGISQLGELLPTLQSRLPLEPPKDKPPPLDLDAEQLAKAARQAVELATRLRATDRKLDLAPLVKLAAAVASQRVEQHDATAVLTQFAKRRTAAGKHLDKPGAWLVKTIGVLLTEAGLDPKGAIPPALKSATNQAIRDAGLEPASAWCPRLARQGASP